MTQQESGYASNDHNEPTTHFINFVPTEGPQRAFQKAYLQVIEYSPEDGKIVLIWSTDIVTIKGTPETLDALHGVLLESRCSMVAYTKTTITSLEIDPVTVPPTHERDPFA